MPWAVTCNSHMKSTGKGGYTAQGRVVVANNGFYRFGDDQAVRNGVGRSLGPSSGRWWKASGGPWWESDVKAGSPLDPFLLTGFERKMLHSSTDKLLMRAAH